MEKRKKTQILIFCISSFPVEQIIFRLGKGRISNINNMNN